MDGWSTNNGSFKLENEKKVHALKINILMQNTSRNVRGLVHKYIFFKVHLALKGVRIYLSSLFKLEVGWVGQSKFEPCSNCKKVHKLMDPPQQSSTLQF